MFICLEPFLRRCFVNNLIYFLYISSVIFFSDVVSLCGQIHSQFSVTDCRLAVNGLGMRLTTLLNKTWRQKKKPGPVKRSILEEDIR